MPGGQTGQDVRIAIKGRVLTAPVGTAAPADVTTAWGAGWNDHGFVDPAGALITPTITSYDVKAWQSDTAIRTRIVERLREIKVILLQLGALNTVLYNGGGTITALGTSNIASPTYTATTAVDSGGAFTVNAFAGKTVYAGNSSMVVVSNTSTALTGTAWSNGTPTAGTPFVIGNGLFQYNAPSPGTDDTRMLGIEWNDGVVIKREFYPQAIVINVDPYSLTSAKEVQLGVTWRCNTDGWYYISNDPIDAPGQLVA